MCVYICVLTYAIWDQSPLNVLMFHELLLSLFGLEQNMCLYLGVSVCVWYRWRG